MFVIVCLVRLFPQDGFSSARMIDSLVALLAEEREPTSHLATVEDTRPTIRLPCYGPYPLTTRLCATVTTLLLGVFSYAVAFSFSRAAVVLEGGE